MIRVTIILKVSEEPEKPLHGSSSFKKGATQPDFKELPPSMRRKYRLFTDEAEEILDSAQAQWVEIEAPEEEEFDEFEGLNLQRKCCLPMCLWLSKTEISICC